ncbi:Rdx family-domain-containing protein [Kockiozyma suomiensis]|uniref:Rdx family-domain-containing protein n=1 Tax=Kockiozyma suomiensis TaxID=1337062 RepID=UPI0033438452
MAAATIRYPRISIEFCTACKWNLRAAWFAQELLSTFGAELGEVSMLPASGGTFIVRLVPGVDSDEVILWDRKEKGGFPDSKDLKRLTRDVLFPTKNLGHVDKHADKEIYASSETKDDRLIADDNGDICVECNAP